MHFHLYKTLHLGCYSSPRSASGNLSNYRFFVRHKKQFCNNFFKMSKYKSMENVIFLRETNQSFGRNRFC